MNAQSTPYVTGDAAFAIDREGNILSWNFAAERLFGRSASRAVGQKCWRVLAGKDPFGNRYCCQHCPIMEMALRGETVHGTRIHVSTVDGERTPLSMSSLVSTSGLGGTRLLHIFREAEADHDGNGYARSSPLPRQNQNDASLTQRELEVLGLLADGRNTREIATALEISHTTVRNHVQHMLGKLNAHNRLEAVVNGRRLRLI